MVEESKDAATQNRYSKTIESVIKASKDSLDEYINYTYKYKDKRKVEQKWRKKVLQDLIESS